MKTYWGSGSIVPRIFHVVTIWRWVVSLKPQPFYPQLKSPWYPLDRRMSGPQSRSGRGGEEKNFLWLKCFSMSSHPHLLYVLCISFFLIFFWEYSHINSVFLLIDRTECIKKIYFLRLVIEFKLQILKIFVLMQLSFRFNWRSPLEEFLCGSRGYVAASWNHRDNRLGFIMKTRTKANSVLQ
jgi:hypothetical protein